MVDLGEDWARGISNVSEVDVLECLEVALAKTMDDIVREFSDDGREVVVGVGE